MEKKELGGLLSLSLLSMEPSSAVHQEARHAAPYRTGWVQIRPLSNELQPVDTSRTHARTHGVFFAPGWATACELQFLTDEAGWTSQAECIVPCLLSLTVNNLPGMFPAPLWELF